MGEAACALARAVGYRGAGTVEFLYSEGEFFFLEMNTRLQVEHPVTEMCYGVDLVAEQLRVAAGAEVTPPNVPQGHAIEVRINAEDPATFLPSLGAVTRLNVPGGPGVRLDAALFRGLEVTPFYDSMIGKLIVHAADRGQAIQRMRRALREMRIVGVATTIPVALAVLADARFRDGDYDTSILEGVDRSSAPERVEVASLAAAVARFCRAEQVEAPRNGAADPISPWTMTGRLERLSGRAR
jgi:acetyl/propionyl-CoA carboxylase alpha subunit